MKRVIVIRKYQTALPQFDDSMDESTGWQGWKPVQQASAQHPQHATQYLQGEYPEEFWSFEGKEASPHHGAAQHRNDDSGTYISVGVRGDAPSGDKMKVGRRHMRGDMPDKRQIVVSRKSAKDVPRYQREKKRLEEKEARAKSKKSRRPPLPRGVGVFKHAESPEAKKHKKEYDTKYETTPERKKYRADLLRERRKRGLEGKGGPDMSHTARGTIVPEDPHTNRARHFKERGTLKKNLNRWFKEKWVDVSRTGKDGKHPPCGRSKAKKSSKGYPKCRPSVKVTGKTPKTSGSMSSGQKRAATKRKRSKKQGVGGKPTIVKGVIVIKEQKKLFQPNVRQTNLFNNEKALVPTDFNAEQRAREEAQAQAQAKEARRQAQMVKVKEQQLKPLDKFGMMKMQMQNATLLLKAQCPTPNKGAYYSKREADDAAQYQSRQAGRPISAYRCVQMGGEGCGMFHLTSG